MSMNIPSSEPFFKDLKTCGLLSGKVAIITGAASGIGQAIAVAFACSGARVIVTDLTLARCKKTLNLITKQGGEGIGYELDVTDAKATKSLAKKLEVEIGNVDVVVNNAGLITRSSMDDPQVHENNRRTMEVNYFGSFNVIHAMIPSLRQTKGCIINIASGAAFVGLAGCMGYSPSKAAVKLLTQSLAQELAADGIRVNALAPGVIETPMTEDTRANTKRLERFLQRIPSGRIGQPHEIAGPAVFLASQFSSYLNGVTLPVDGGYLAV